MFTESVANGPSRTVTLGSLSFANCISTESDKNAANAVLRHKKILIRVFFPRGNKASVGDHEGLLLLVSLAGASPTV